MHWHRPVPDARGHCYICCDDNQNPLNIKSLSARIERVSQSEVSPGLLDRLTSGEIDVLVVTGPGYTDVPIPNGADAIHEVISKTALRLSDCAVHAYPYSAVHGIPKLSSDDYHAAGLNSEHEIRSMVGDAVVDTLYGTLAAFGIGSERKLTGGNGRPFASFTLRLLLEGSKGIGIHCENAFLCELEDEFRHGLEGQVQLDRALSLFTVIQEPQKGGDLLLYDLKWDDAPIEAVGCTLEERHPANLDFFRSRGHGTPDSETVRLKRGDTVMFQASQMWHAVSPVTDGHRVTIGCFVAKDNLGAYHFWA